MLFSLRRDNDVNSIVAWTICSNSIPRVSEFEGIWRNLNEVCRRQKSISRSIIYSVSCHFAPNLWHQSNKKTSLKVWRPLRKCFIFMPSLSSLCSISRARKSINNMKILLWKKRFLCRVVLKAFFSFLLLAQPFSFSFFYRGRLCRGFRIFMDDNVLQWLPYPRHENWKALPPDNGEFLKTLSTVSRRVMLESLFDREKRRRNRRRRSCSKLYQVSLSCLNIQVRSDKMKLVESGSW